MKLMTVCFVVLMTAGSCRESCREHMVQLYATGNRTFTQQRKIHDFSMQLSWIPGSLLVNAGSKNSDPVVQDTGFYYFKVNVACPATTAMMVSNKTELLYGLDSLFAIEGSSPLANPVLVEPVITGNQRFYEYLLVFAKKDFKNDRQLKVVFFDRLFTNTQQVFVFDRIKIDEIETLQCHAHEA
jgi:hypothetical protein